jgi:hypothetical protein
MEIEIGKTYSVSPLYKKCFVEAETFINCDDSEQKMIVSTLWRNGTVNVTPQNQDEVDILEAASYAEDDDEFEPYQFEEFEFVSTWDGVSVDIDFVGGHTDEKKQYLDEGYSEDGFFFLEAEGYDSEESNIVMHGELEIEEFKGYAA